MPESTEGVSEGSITAMSDKTHENLAKIRQKWNLT